jgi:hypothetical protein
MLHPVNRDVKGGVYCGPTAIAAITGQPVSVIYKRLRRVRADRDRKNYGKVPVGGALKRMDGHKRPIVGTSNHEVLTVLERLGYPSVAMDVVGRKLARGWGGMQSTMTLRRFCDDMAHLGPTLIEVTGHYVAVSRGMILDTQTGYVPIPWRDYPKLGWRVQRWWRFNEK